MEIVTLHTDMSHTIIQGVGGIFFFNEGWTHHKRDYSTDILTHQSVFETSHE